MELFIEKTDEKRKMRFSGTALQLLLRLNINPEAVIVVRNKTVITEKDSISDKDSVEILSVVSGG